MIAEKNPKINRAVGVLKEISADEKTRILSEQRDKARRDYVARIEGAMEEGGANRAFAIAKNMLDIGMPIDDIANITGLTREEVEGLST